MSASFVVRAADLTHDLPAIFLLDELCFEPPFRFTYTQTKRYACTAGAITLVAEACAGASFAGLAGAVMLQIDDVRRSGYVVTLDVHPEARRLGLASRLLYEAEQRARAEQVQSFSLHVSAENEGAMLFYERCGYVPAEWIADLYGPGYDGWLCNKRAAQEM